MAIKSDDLWEHIDAIDAVIPNRRVILLTRDFRDNLVSVMGKHFGPAEPICAARYIKRQFVLYDSEYRRAGANGYHVRFDTLVQSPRVFVEDFARHFGLVPSPDSEKALQTIPPRPNKIEKWRKLPHRDLAWCEAILRDQLLEFGYRPEYPTATLPGPATIAAAEARDAIKRVPQKLRRLAARMRP
jgi:hypothetical protein